MPGSFQGTTGSPSGPSALPSAKGFEGGDLLYPCTYLITGITRDSNGNPLGNCTVTLFRTADNSVAAQMVSDGSGNFSFVASAAFTHYVVAYLAGAPDVEGTGSNQLVAVSL